MSEAKHDRRVVEGFRLPLVGSPTENELSWIEFLRIIFDDHVPPPHLKIAQTLNAMRLGEASIVNDQEEHTKHKPNSCR